MMNSTQSTGLFKVEGASDLSMLTLKCLAYTAHRKTDRSTFKDELRTAINFVAAMSV